MAHYTIDTDADAQYVEGDYGEGLTCHLAARRMALSALPDLARDRVPDGDQGTFRAIVRDENGIEIYAATLTLVGEWKVTPPSS
ncbi:MULTISPECIES: hypothetical protein [unclassified Methylobacterium]|uniref:DUF6894 family protein n=1 Tax=unclassified Methylobacterium TaxID=2615210 RepID=UPI0011C1D3FC|nr:MULTISPECIES: hypothetical protein [unclassified Methylobacterium]QEE38953.1 hypothetical protein FVA80_08320 [Methylobacterium sp. WL1]TXN50609.1 hypothetical protein FV241_30625 [Methylobacterium sp. WL2]